MTKEALQIHIQDNYRSTSSTPLLSEVKPSKPKLYRKSQLNKILVNKDGSPDYLCINLYFDTFNYIHVPKIIKNKDGTITKKKKIHTKEYFISYDKIEATHGCSKETTRRKIVKLEKAGLVSRNFNHKTSNVHTKSYNRMSIFVWKDTPHFYNEHGVSKEDAGELIPYTSHKHVEKKHGTVFDANILENISPVDYNLPLTRVDTKEENLNIEDIIESRSTSEFSKDSSKEVSEAEDVVESENNQTISTDIIINQQIHKKKQKKLKPQPERRKALSSNIKRSFTPKIKDLTDYLHSLTETIAIELRKRSGRDFTFSAIKKIMLKLVNKGFKPTFRSIKGFIAYMSEILEHEMHETTTLNKETFTPTVNISSEELEIREQERFLEKIEAEEGDRTPQATFKRKIAYELARETSCAILKPLSKATLEDGVLTLKTRSMVDIDDDIMSRIEDIAYQAWGEPVESVKIITDQRKPRAKKATNSNKSLEIDTEQDWKQSIESEEYKVWGSIRAQIGRYYDWFKESHWIHKNISCRVDETTKEIKLTSKTGFAKSWIDSHYFGVMERVANEQGYSLKPIVI
jgi:hypothetical protein